MGVTIWATSAVTVAVGVSLFDPLLCPQAANRRPGTSSAQAANERRRTPRWVPVLEDVGCGFTEGRGLPPTAIGSLERLYAQILAEYGLTVPAFPQVFRIRGPM